MVREEVGDEVGADTYRDVWVKVFGEKLAILPALTTIEAFVTARANLLAPLLSFYCKPPRPF